MEKYFEFSVLRKTMPPKKKVRSEPRKKRKFYGNRFTPRKEASLATGGSESRAENNIAIEEEEVRPIVGQPADYDQETPTAVRQRFKSLPASVRKLADVINSDSNADSSSLTESDIEEEFPENEGFRFIDIDILSAVFDLLICPKCKLGHVSMSEDATAKRGFASKLSVSCQRAGCSFKEYFYTSKKIGRAFEVNRRAVLGARNVGIGKTGLDKFAALMNIPAPLNPNAYRDTVTILNTVAREAAEESMETAAEAVKEFYDEEDDEICNIGVSGDGTWRRRGFKSSTGVVSAISVVTGKVLDVEVMSKECRECMNHRKDEGSQEFNEWWEGHQHRCYANFAGSSGRMDPVGCYEIFSRSITKHNLRYKEFLGDGDSKAYNQLVQENVYGDDHKVEKLECVGHVQKRMGSRLRSLKKRIAKTKLRDGKTLGGKGRLTDARIDSLQVYYGKAIRENVRSLQSMKNAVNAIWHHIRSTDESPQHHLCPEGETSWCGFQRDLANGTELYHHDHPLPEAITEEIRPTFDALSAENLLEACLHGGTQNQNESFNALIWQRAPKEYHSSLPTVELSTYLAVGHFNDGAQFMPTILEKLGIKPGQYCQAACKKFDKKRIKNAMYKSSDKVKKRRKTIRNKKKGYSDAQQEEEGPQYASGAF